MPKTDGEIRTLIREASSPADHNVAYLEELVKYAGTAMPSSAMAVYASNWGTIKGMLLMADFRLVRVPPKTWIKALSLGGRRSHPSKTAWKNHLKQRAQELFPQINVTLATADALLIFEAARRGLLG